MAAAATACQAVELLHQPTSAGAPSTLTQPVPALLGFLRQSKRPCRTEHITATARGATDRTGRWLCIYVIGARGLEPGGADGNLEPEGDREMSVYSLEDRMRAVELYFKYGGRSATVRRELGYPTKNTFKQ